MIPPTIAQEAEKAAEKRVGVRHVGDNKFGRILDISDAKTFDYRTAIEDFKAGTTWLFQHLCKMADAEFDENAAWNQLDEITNGDRNLIRGDAITLARHQHALTFAKLLEQREEIARLSKPKLSKREKAICDDMGHMAYSVLSKKFEAERAKVKELESEVEMKETEVREKYYQGLNDRQDEIDDLNKTIARLTTALRAVERSRADGVNPTAVRRSARQALSEGK